MHHFFAFATSQIFFLCTFYDMFYWYVTSIATKILDYIFLEIFLSFFAGIVFSEIAFSCIFLIFFSSPVAPVRSAAPIVTLSVGMPSGLSASSLILCDTSVKP